MGMPRPTRLDLPGVPQHLVQRGNNRLPCFLDDDDRQRYLQLLRKYSRETHCSIHAYVLMQNHVHMLVTAHASGELSKMMQSLGRSYVHYFNVRHGRSGTLWEGRFKSCLVADDAYLLACYRYIELNPVRARVVAHPAEFPWSSYGRNALGACDSLVTPHPTYISLGQTKQTRTESYARLVSERVPPSVIGEIRQYLQQQRALGNDDFKKMVEAKTQRFAGIRPASRPKKSTGQCGIVVDVHAVAARPVSHSDPLLGGISDSDPLF